MSQIRPNQLIQQIDTNDQAGGQHRAFPITPSVTNTTPLQLFTDSQPALTPGDLSTILAALPVTATTARALRIPGSPKRTPTTEELPKPVRRMDHRLRQSIVLGAILFVTIATLLSLAPLDNGQSPFPIFKGFSDWVHAQQASWTFQAHETQTAQNNPLDSTQQLAAPPPITLPKSEYVAIAQQDASNVGISPDYFTRQINQESGFNPYAVSPSGAEGIAQFEPGTAAGLGINPFDPIAALNAAAHLMANYAHNYGGNYAMALAAYNGGSGTVQGAINACGAANWMNCLPAQTRNYIYVIMGI